MLEEEAVPEELKQEIEERKEMDFKLTYEDNGKLYICLLYTSRCVSETAFTAVEMRQTGIADVTVTEQIVGGSMKIVGSSY